MSGYRLGVCVVHAISLSACLSPGTVECFGGFLCPAGKTCAPQTNTCVLPEQLSACRSPKGDGDPCTYSGSAGTCAHGICLPAGSGCGNGILDPNELCDDGNTVAGDGCSSDCHPEVCGNGIVDPGTTEVCDCGDGTSLGGAECMGLPNADVGQALCSTTCTLRSCGDGAITGSEECEGTNLGGATCPGVGTLSCSPTCKLDYSTCRRWMPMTSGTPYHVSSLAGTGPANIFAAAGGGTILHYDGSAWSGTTIGTGTEALASLWLNSASDMFAVGDPGTSIFHFNGSAWSSMSSGTTYNLAGVWASGPSDAFAVGQYKAIVHYNGSAWSQMNLGAFGPPGPAIPNRHFSAVWGSGPSDVFAVANQGTVLHYNGSAWSLMTSGTTEDLFDVWGTGPSSVYAIGHDMFGHNTVVLHYDGSSWSPMVATFAGDPGLFGIWGSSSSDLFAVGFDGAIFHYDGSAWSATPSGTIQTLLGVWGSSAADVFAVGEFGAILHLQ